MSAQPLSKDPRIQGPRGIVRMPMNEYLEHPALSRSVLDKIAISPRHLHHYVEFGEHDTPAFLQGRVLHSLLLEPAEFWQRVVVWNGGDKVKNAGAWKRFKEEHAGKEIITEEQEQQFRMMQNVFETKPLTRRLLEGAKIEAAAFWARDGLLCKARPDVIKGSTLYDLKSASDASFEGFTRDAYKFGYHRQAAWYLDGLSVATGKRFTDFCFVVIEKSPPFEVQVFYCTPEFIEKGRAENEENFELFKACLELGNWPGFPEVVQQLSLPRWAQ